MLLLAYTIHFSHYLRLRSCLLFICLSRVPSFIDLQLFKHVILHSVSLYCIDDCSIFEYFDVFEAKLGSSTGHLLPLLFSFLCLLFAKYFSLSKFLIFICDILLISRFFFSSIFLPLFRGFTIQTLDGFLSDIWTPSPVSLVSWCSECLPVHFTKDFQSSFEVFCILRVLSHYDFGIKGSSRIVSWPQQIYESLTLQRSQPHISYVHKDFAYTASNIQVVLVPPLVALVVFRIRCFNCEIRWKVLVLLPNFFWSS